MSGKKRKLGLKAVIILCVAVFLAGYLVGSFAPLPTDGDSFFGLMRRPGSNNHRNR